MTKLFRPSAHAQPDPPAMPETNAGSLPASRAMTVPSASRALTATALTSAPSAASAERMPNAQWSTTLRSAPAQTASLEIQGLAACQFFSVSVSMIVPTT